MKKRLHAPAIGLTLVLLLAGCGGGGGGTAEPPPVDPPPDGETPVPPPPPPPPTTANSVVRVKAAMSGASAGSSTALTTHALANVPYRDAAATPLTNDALGAFGQVLVADGNAATNTRVQLRNVETFIYTNAGGGRWSRVQFGHRVLAASYPANYGAGAVTPLNPGTGPSSLRADPGGGVSVKPVADRVIRFWPESGVVQSLLPTPRGGIQAIFTTAQARLVKDNAAGADDIASAKYLVNTGAAWWSTVPAAGSADYRNGVTNGGARLIGAGRMELVLPEWQAMNFHSATGAQVDALATAPAGGVAPLANSATFTPRDVTRIMPVGDSITQGNQGGQDSYRRLLWNKLVSDATLPIVDFAGTRTGTRGVNGSCFANSDHDGNYQLPEFDVQHQAYWGYCIEDVADVLPAALNALAPAGQAASTPDIALVHLGTNDLTQDASGATNDTPAEARAELQGIVNQLKAANPAMQVLVSELLPSQDAGQQIVIGQFNCLLRPAGAGCGSPPAPTGLTGATVIARPASYAAATDNHDTLHPGPSGEEKFASGWLTAIKPLLPAP